MRSPWPRPHQDPHLPLGGNDTIQIRSSLAEHYASRIRSVWFFTFFNLFFICYFRVRYSSLSDLAGLAVPVWIQFNCSTSCPTSFNQLPLIQNFITSISSWLNIFLTNVYVILYFQVSGILVCEAGCILENLDSFLANQG